MNQQKWKMRRWSALWIGIVCLLLSSTPLMAEARLGRGVYYDGAWWSFVRGGGLAAAQSGRNVYTYSGEFSWNPWLGVTPWFAFRGNFGVSYFRAVNTDKFLVSEYELQFSFSGVGPVNIEIGGGAQTWWGQGGTHPLASGTLLIPVDEPSLAWFRYVYFGYSGYFIPNLYTHVIRTGIEVTFW